MHGYNNGVFMVKLLCNDYDIIFLQEHWLCDSNCHKLDKIDCNFQSIRASAMNKKLGEGILTGRPFGRTAILWRKQLTNHVRFTDRENKEGRDISVY